MLYVLEANPRASRTVPFVSKATAVPLAKAAARVMLGESIASLRGAGVLAAEGDGGDLPPDAPIAVKEAVMPFNRFKTPDGQTVDTVLGPEMRSTGEVMGFDAVFGRAFAKSQAAAYGPLPLPTMAEAGRVFASMANRDKRTMIFPIKRLADLGFEILATQGTAEVLRRNGIDARIVRKHYEGTGPAGEPTTVQLIADGEIDLIVNTPHGRAAGGSARTDGYEIRTAAVLANVPCITTVQGLGAAVQGIEAMRAGEIDGPVAPGLGGTLTAYDLLFRHGLARFDPERAHHLGFRASGPPGRRCGRLPRPGDAGAGDGADLPERARTRRRVRQERRRHRRPRGARVRPRRGRHRDRASRSRATRSRGCSGCPADRAVVNRMGFNNDGAEAVAARLAQRGARPTGGERRDRWLGVNIGKTKVVPEDDQAAVEADYRKSAGLLAPYADYLVVNVSSPNTPGLRTLQSVERLGPLLTRCGLLPTQRLRTDGCRCW